MTHDLQLPADATTVYFWGAKGGVGTSTVAALHALAVARAGYPTTLTASAAQLADLVALLAVPVHGAALDINAVAAAPATPGLTPYAVIDGGTDPGRDLCPSQRYLVTRPCYLALRRATQTGVAGTHGIVLVTEPQRALGQADIEDVLGIAVVATMEVTQATAPWIDAGLLTTRPGRRSPIRWVDTGRWRGSV